MIENQTTISTEDTMTTENVREIMIRDALKEAMGYILGMGFAFKAKPEAFASSSCANKVVN